jgi:hypothetical protein
MIELRSQDVDLDQLVDIERPLVFAAPRAPRASGRAASDASGRRNPRFSKRARVRDEAAPGEIPYRVAPSNTSTVQQLAQQSQLIARVKGDQEFIGEIREKAQAYATSAAMKRIIRETDHMDHFACPLQDRILHELTPERYPDFVSRKNAAIRRIDAEPPSPHRVPKVPCVSVSTKGLRDPAYRYRHHLQNERNITNFLTGANGQEIPEQPKHTERTLDYSSSDVLRRTRFYYGATEEANRVGRKAFPNHNRSRVRRVLDNFGGPRLEDPD